ncbi:transporter substrate-binding domain-containing protein [Vibrio tubiashii]|uniref:substrate-binding periplasmic protein n=1 Tax=Vibrio tubiashii TaxID=29498 RepID=UPI00234F9179|nr:transporter substrate-binding domain-containing protein [Vibrio tubiashii]WCP66691.1 transporter substrate-binding domain-containing protein [Vibrio tubiashii]
MRLLNAQLFVFSLLYSTFISATTITLAYSDIESYPYQLGNGNYTPEPPGLSLDILNQVAAQLNIKIKYFRLPGKRVLEYIESGEVDGGFIFSYNPTRAQYAQYPMKGALPDGEKRIATLGYYFYKLKGQPLEWDGANFSKLENNFIAAHLGFSITSKLKQNNIKVHEAKTTEQLFAMLRSRRIEAIAIQNTIAQEYLRDKPWSDEIEQVLPAITTKDYFLIFNQSFANSSPDLVNQIWLVISEIRDKVVSEKNDKY